MTALPLITIAHFADLLGELRRETPGMLNATLATADGLTLASTLSNSHEADRLAAMSSSLAGLSSALTRETGHGTPRQLILSSDQGHIVSMQVPLPTGEVVLTVVTTHKAVLGKLLWSCRQTAEQMTLAALPA
ncbi:roadblock/LC7 domain-containing protein [Hydrogenophaga sp.]|uniref:roadblock/LC7 domain-containing protein n=1 Tax=Hydrogenophaga sp. TaxID=1904254 RepID=UPI00271E80DD|nr:roadblock/LC7 domain-containing protein [Hydrogenophaga sp.]MDO9436912.1 roadblock/LC7 domain-containing protein [Hydrogenophaga sp.]